jgi:hypothetical protein
MVAAAKVAPGMVAAAKVAPGMVAAAKVAPGMVAPGKVAAAKATTERSRLQGRDRKALAQNANCGDPLAFRGGVRRARVGRGGG